MKYVLVFFKIIVVVIHYITLKHYTILLFLCQNIYKYVKIIVGNVMKKVIESLIKINFIFFIGMIALTLLSIINTNNKIMIYILASSYHLKALFPPSRYNP